MLSYSCSCFFPVPTVSGWSISKPKPLGSSSKRRGCHTCAAMPAAGRCFLCTVDWHSSFAQPSYYFTQSLFLSLLQWTADCSEQLDGSCSPSRGKGSSSHEHNQVGFVFSSSCPELCLYFLHCLAWEGLPAVPLLWKGRCVPLLGIWKLIPAHTMGGGQHPDVQMDAFIQELKGEKYGVSHLFRKTFLLSPVWGSC